MQNPAGGKIVVFLMLLTIVTTGVSAQSPKEIAVFDSEALVKELGLPEEKAESVRALVKGLLTEIQSSGRAMFALLSPQKPEELFDPQLSTRIEQVRKALALKIEKFQLDMEDFAGEIPARSVTGRISSALPAVLLGERAKEPSLVPGASPAHTASAHLPGEVPPGSGGAQPAVPNLDLDLDLDISGGNAKSGSSMGGMGGMMGMMDSMMGMMANMKGMKGMGPMQSGSMSGMGGSGAAESGLSSQLLSLNAVIDQMLKTIASQQGDASESQLRILEQLIANQTSLIRLLPSGGGSPAPMNMGDM